MYLALKDDVYSAVLNVKYEQFLREKVNGP